MRDAGGAVELPKASGRQPDLAQNEAGDVSLLGRNIARVRVKARASVVRDASGY